MVGILIGEGLSEGLVAVVKLCFLGLIKPVVVLVVKGCRGALVGVMFCWVWVKREGVISRLMRRVGSPRFA